MDVNGVAKKVCADLFECGDERDSPANRIQFMGGSWLDETETPQGGFCKEALEKFIARSLKKHVN